MPAFAYNFAIGTIWIEEHTGCIISLGCEKEQLKEKEISETPLIKQVKQQLDEYFALQRTEFTFPISLSGTPFFQSVYQTMLDIPYGKTKTYGEIAKMLHSQGARAVGLACKRNPLMLVVPCHRVIGANGKLTGFYGGLDMKEQLLQLEQNHDFKKRKQHE